MWSRIHLIPLLQAEEDRDQVRRYLADQNREKELLGENLKVYNNEKYVGARLAVLSCHLCSGSVRIAWCEFLEEDFVG